MHVFQFSLRAVGIERSGKQARMLRMKQCRRQIHGSYEPHSFIMRLSSESRVFSTDSIADDADNRDLFVHEYWHYWHNISTVASLKTLHISQSILSIFSAS